MCARTSARQFHDWRTWGYTKQGLLWFDGFMQPATDPQPDTFNERSERAHAVLALPDGDFMVFGERDYKDEFNELFTRVTGQATRATAPATATSGRLPASSSPTTPRWRRRSPI